MSLIWQGQRTTEPVSLDKVVSRLRSAHRSEIAPLLESLLDCLGESERFALLKLATGGLRVGVSARMLKLALASFGDKAPEEIEELWFGLKPPYCALFAWLEGRAPAPAADPQLRRAAAPTS